MQVKADGLYLAIPEISTSYCTAPWAGVNVFIPESSPHYSYLYGLALTSVTKGNYLYIYQTSVYITAPAFVISQKLAMIWRHFLQDSRQGAHVSVRLEIESDGLPAPRKN